MADLPIVGHINHYAIVSGITIEDGGNDFPIFFYLELPPSRGQNPEKMHLVACKRAPVAVSATIHPGTFQPRKNIVGLVQALAAGRRQSGACRWQVPPFVFWQE